MSFEDLNKDFEARHPRCLPTGSRFWFNAEWKKGNESINDLLIRWLKEWNLPYLRDLNGNIWFLFDGEWTNCTHNVFDDIVTFSINLYEM